VWDDFAGYQALGALTVSLSVTTAIDTVQVAVRKFQAVGRSFAASEGVDDGVFHIYFPPWTIGGVHPDNFDQWNNSYDMSQARFRVGTREYVDASDPYRSYVSSSEKADFFYSTLSLIPLSLSREATAISNGFSNIFQGKPIVDTSELYEKFEDKGVKRLPLGEQSLTAEVGSGVLLSFPSQLYSTYQFLGPVTRSNRTTWEYADAEPGEEPRDWRSPGRKDPPEWGPEQVCEEAEFPARYANIKDSKLYTVEQGDMEAALFGSAPRDVPISVSSLNAETGACVTTAAPQIIQKVSPLTGVLPPYIPGSTLSVIAAGPSVVKRANARPPASP
jgi:hypothetical protein